MRLVRSRGLSALDFAVGTAQEQRILELCAALDDTARADLAAQQLLWEKMLRIPLRDDGLSAVLHTRRPRAGSGSSPPRNKRPTTPPPSIPPAVWRRSPPRACASSTSRSRRGGRRHEVHGARRARVLPVVSRRLCRVV
jgi:hypothetical protein